MQSCLCVTDQKFEAGCRTARGLLGCIPRWNMMVEDRTKRRRLITALEKRGVEWQTVLPLSEYIVNAVRSPSAWRPMHALINSRFDPL